MVENKLKHLEFTQAVINRMDKNSFLLKGWCVTLIAGLFVLSNNNYDHTIIVYLIPPMFCFIDGYYLSQQRKFIWLYNQARLKNNDEIDFDMETSGCSVFRCSWFSSIFSKVHFIFYGAIVASTYFITHIIQ